MIKYHGTPVGGTKHDAIKFLDGRHALICFAHPSQTAEVLECCDSFCIDNGAFPIWKKGQGKIDIDKYIDFIEGIATHPSFDFLLIPDIITGSVSENDKLIEGWSSKFESVPVYHLGEPVSRFKELARGFNKVALGSTDKWPRNGSKLWWKNMADFMDEVTDERGVLPCKIHGLRMLDPKIFSYIPLHSGDSTNAGVNGHIPMKKGIYKAVTRWQGNERVAQRIESWQSAPFWDRQRLILDGILEE